MQMIWKYECSGFVVGEYRGPVSMKAEDIISVGMKAEELLACPLSEFPGDYSSCTYRERRRSRLLILFILMV
jgi:hypothetical protein